MRTWLPLLMLALSTPLAAQQGAPPLAPGEALLQVSGSGKVLAVPDTATVETGVASDGATAERALAANAAAAGRLVAALRAARVSDEAIRTTAVRVAPRFRSNKDGNDSDEVIGYRATHRLRVRLAKGRDPGPVIDVLARAGATDIDGPTFSFGDEAPLLARARVDAVARAERQARDYAVAFGLRDMRLVRISERAVDVDERSDIVVTGRRKGTPISAGEQEVGVTVWVDYAVHR